MSEPSQNPLPGGCSRQGIFLRRLHTVMRIRTLVDNVVVNYHVFAKGDIIDLEMVHARKAALVARGYAEWVEDHQPTQAEPPRPEAAAMDHGAVETTTMPRPSKKPR